MWAAKLAQRNRCPVDAVETKAQGNGVEPQRVTKLDDDFQVKGEPFYGGKGDATHVFWYMVEVYVDDFMSLVIPVS